MPVPSQGHYGFHSFPVVDWFCLFIYLCVLTFPLLDCSEFGNFVITLIVCKGVHVYFKLFVYACVYIGVQHILCCAFVLFFFVLLPVYLACPFVIAPSVFSNVYCIILTFNVCLTLKTVCQWLAGGRWFPPDTPVSSTNNSDLHTINDIFLKVMLSTISPNTKRKM